MISGGLGLLLFSGFAGGLVLRVEGLVFVLVWVVKVCLCYFVLDGLCCAVVGLLWGVTFSASVLLFDCAVVV